MTDSGNTGKGKQADKNPPPAKSKHPEDRPTATEPEWAASLKQLYNSVVEEPLPDSFRELLAKLDSGKK